MNTINDYKNDNILELRNVTKKFPGVIALNNVNIKLRRGEILALIGENGAGKSTLINCITGVLEPEAGQILINGNMVKLKNPQIAFANGISVVHQERNLIDSFDVAENIFLDRICGSVLSMVDGKSMHEEAKSLLKRLNLDLDPYDRVEGLSSAQKQVIEIARALSINANILLLDEPTASISIKEANLLLEIIKDLKKQGVSIIYVSHKLEEIFAIADRIKVIRDGENVGDEIPVNDIDIDTLIDKMVGNREILKAFPSKDNYNADTVLEVKNITSANNPNATSFNLKKGEILGWYGLVGSGRTELAREIIGIDPIKKGEVYINGKKAKITSYKNAYEKYHISYLSENRKEEGLFLSHTISKNMCIVDLDSVMNKAGFHSSKKEQKLAEKYRELLRIKLSSTKHIVSSLSGGNQQKVCIAKCLITEPEIIIIDEPTVGIDVNTKAEIHKLIYNLSQKGKSIILISSDFPEMIQLAERIMVFNEGTIVGELKNSKDYEKTSSKVMEMILDVNKES